MHIGTIIDALTDLKKRAGKPKKEFITPVVDSDLDKSVRDLASKRLSVANQLTDKAEREEAVSQIKKETRETLAERFPEKEKAIGAIIDLIEYEDLRKRVLDEGKRAELMPKFKN